MFKSPLLLLFVCLTTALSAQVTYGTIDYVKTTEYVAEEALGDLGENKELKAAFAELRTGGAMDDNFRATFTPEAFTFNEQVKPVTSKTIEMGGGNTIMIETGGGDPTFYHTDLVTGAIHNSTTIEDRMFLVTGDAQPLDWQLTGETVKPGVSTMGLELKLATAVNALGDTVTAGFAPALPVRVGPENYYGPYGAIITLRVPTSAKAVRVYYATGLSPLQEAPELTLGQDGKKITPERFNAQVLKRRDKGPLIIQRSN